MEHEVVELEHVCPAFDVAVYPVIAEPPSYGALQLTVVDAFPPDVAEIPVGASGLVIATLARIITGSLVMYVVMDPLVVAVPRLTRVEPVIA
jgi:hypothetical protein